MWKSPFNVSGRIWLRAHQQTEILVVSKEDSSKRTMPPYQRIPIRIWRSGAADG